MSAPPSLDHLILTVPDLDAGIGWVEERLGVRAAVGGRLFGVDSLEAPRLPTWLATWVVLTDGGAPQEADP